MESWRPQVYRAQAPPSVDEDVLDNAVAIGSLTASIGSRLPPIFSLRHLAHYTAANYSILRDIVCRRRVEPYRTFRIQKRSLEGDGRRFRRICVPEPTLRAVQQWINRRILSCAAPHEASTAFAMGSSVKRAAERHCCARWLIKVDLTRFFESISEVRVYRVFLSLGYQPLVSLELARLCTRVDPTERSDPHWTARCPTTIREYVVDYLGHLPQGAPTSPMLANFAMLEFDEKLIELAARYGLQYSRYADDITLSTGAREFSYGDAKEIIHLTYSHIGQFGLSPNVAKTSISPPGARKVVLGLLVDGPQPRLTRSFRHNLRRHLHYLLNPKVGPSRHAGARGFTAVAGLKNHVAGLIAFAHDIDPRFAASCWDQFDRINWPV